MRWAILWIMFQLKYVRYAGSKAPYFTNRLQKWKATVKKAVKLRTIPIWIIYHRPLSRQFKVVGGRGGWEWMLTWDHSYTCSCTFRFLPAPSFVKGGLNMSHITSCFLCWGYKPGTKTFVKQVINFSQCKFPFPTNKYFGNPANQGKKGLLSHNFTRICIYFKYCRAYQSIG